MPKLSNPNADRNAQKMYDYICQVQGNYVLTGQQECPDNRRAEFEMRYLHEVTGKLPAIRGLDYMGGEFENVNRRALEWHKKGGIVSICWHTGINGYAYRESKEDVPDFEKLFDESTEEHKNMIANWDLAANALAELRDAGVPILWRPFHEFDGGWFWWGKGKPADFIKLWHLMYDRYTNTFNLTNLIWVLGYADYVRDGWYVGDDYCDVIGSDTYRFGLHEAAYQKLWADFGRSRKPFALHECGNLPDVTELVRKRTMWSWFLIWHMSSLTGNDVENLKKMYDSEFTLTLDKLPKFEWN